MLYSCSKIGAHFILQGVKHFCVWPIYRKCWCLLYQMNIIRLIMSYIFTVNIFRDTIVSINLVKCEICTPLDIRTSLLALVATRSTGVLSNLAGKWNEPIPPCSALCCSVFASAVMIVSIQQVQAARALATVATWQVATTGRQQVDWWSSSSSGGVALTSPPAQHCSCSWSWKKRMQRHAMPPFCRQEWGVSPVLVCISKRIKLLLLQAATASQQQRKRSPGSLVYSGLSIVKWIMEF